MSFRILFAASAVLAITTPPDLRAQAQSQAPRDRLTIADYFDWEDVSNPTLSPDGRQVIYTRTWIDKINDKRESSLWIMNSDGTRNRFLTKGATARWAPDGSRIAFVAPGEPGGQQVWVRYMDADGPATQITRLTESPSDIEWSPDGKSIAFGMLVRGSDNWRMRASAGCDAPTGSSVPFASVSPRPCSHTSNSGARFRPSSSRK